jgi:hypothetical protein
LWAIFFFDYIFLVIFYSLKFQFKRGVLFDISFYFTSLTKVYNKGFCVLGTGFEKLDFFRSKWDWTFSKLGNFFFRKPQMFLRNDSGQVNFWFQIGINRAKIEEKNSKIYLKKTFPDTIRFRLSELIAHKFLTWFY